MEVIIRPFKDDISKLNKLCIPFQTFQEKFQSWVNISKKSKKSKLGLLTPEIFSLNYDSLLSELKESLFVIVNTDEELNLVDSNFNVIEYV